MFPLGSNGLAAYRAAPSLGGGSVDQPCPIGSPVVFSSFEASGGNTVRRRGGGEDPCFAAPAFAGCAFVEVSSQGTDRYRNCQAVRSNSILQLMQR
jgi:hypothetical protein